MSVFKGTSITITMVNGHQGLITAAGHLGAWHNQDTGNMVFNATEMSQSVLQLLQWQVCSFVTRYTLRISVQERKLAQVEKVTKKESSRRSFVGSITLPPPDLVMTAAEWREALGKALMEGSFEVLPKEDDA